MADRAPFAFCPHPPGTPLLVRVGIAAFGQSEVGARAMSFLLGMLTLVPVYMLTRELGGARAGAWALVAFASTPVFAAFGAIATPDAAQLFCYTTALLLTWRAMTTGRMGWWVGAGSVVALGLYVKYVGILYYPALLVCLLATPAGRQHLRMRGPYIALIMPLILFVPFAAWQDSLSGWATLKYHLRDRQQFVWPSAGGVAGYHLLHFVYYSPLLYGLFLVTMARLSADTLRSKEQSASFLAAFSVLPWVFFAVIAAFTRRELSREQWDAIAYIPALIGTSVWLTRTERANSIISRIAPAVGAVILLTVAVESSTGLVSRAAGRMPLFSKVSGWRSMSARTEQELAELPGPEFAFVTGNSFAPVLEYHFYSRNPAKVFSFDSEKNMHYGIQDMLDRTGAGVDSLKKHPGSNAIYILEEKAVGADVAQRGRREREMRRLYQTVTETPELKIELGGRHVKTFRFYKCEDLK